MEIGLNHLIPGLDKVPEIYTVFPLLYAANLNLEKVNIFPSWKVHLQSLLSAIGFWLTGHRMRKTLCT